jgi:hypothetical protein
MTNLSELDDEDAARPGTFEDPIAWRFTKSQKEAIDAHFDIVCQMGYDRGVSDAREHSRNPNHIVGYSSEAIRKANEAAKAPSTTQSSSPNPGDLAARARAIQIEGEKSGKNISNIEAVKMAYEEAKIPWQ